MRWILGLLLLACVGASAQTVLPGTSPPSTTPAPTAPGPLDSIRNWFSGSGTQPDLLSPEEAFKFSVVSRGPDRLVALLTPAVNYYLYRDRISFAVIEPSTVSIDKVTLPRGQPKADPTFGTVDVFHGPVEAVISLQGPTRAGDKIQLRASYQGCNEPLGVCYPPVEKTLTLTLLDAASAGASADTSLGTVAQSGFTDASDAFGIRELFTSRGNWALIAAFFGFGILLAFTPCMLPMIPILSGIIAGQGQHLSRGQALGLSASYVLGMAITYALAGVAAGLAGTMLSAYLQNPWVLGSFAAVFVLLALSMFGLYELQLPSAIQSRLARLGSGIRGGRAIGAFLMGVLSAVIVGPCVAAPLAGALLYIGQTKDVLLGAVALFTLALGMGLPLLFFGTAAGTLLPRSGAWTVSINRIFGVTMLALAIYVVSPVLPILLQQLLWAALLILTAIYLHAMDPLPAAASGYRRLFKGVGVMALVTGIALLIGALSGHRDILQPLAGLRGVASAQPRELAFQTVSSLADLDTRIQAARGRPVLLDFWAEWCVSCKEMDRFTFADSRVQDRLKSTLLLRADVTANTEEHRAMLKRFSLFGPPGIVFFDRDGREVPFQVIGYQPADKFLASLDRAGAFN